MIWFWKYKWLVNDFSIDVRSILAYLIRLFDRRFDIGFTPYHLRVFIYYVCLPDFIAATNKDTIPILTPKQHHIFKPSLLVADNTVYRRTVYYELVKWYQFYCKQY